LGWRIRFYNKEENGEEPEKKAVASKISTVRLRACMYDIGYWQSLHGRFSASRSGFIEDFAQLADPSNGDRLAVLFLAIDGQKDGGDQAGKHLDHETMAA